MKRQVVFGFGLIVALVLAGCAAAGPARQEVFPESAVGMVAPAERGAADFAMEEAAEFDNQGLVRSSLADDFQPAERIVIRSANLSLVVPEPSESVQEISQLAEEMGGFVVSSNVFQTFFAEAGVSADRASVTIRVPAERLDEALEQIRAGATEVQNESISGQDVTQEFTDLQSQLRNLEAAEQQLLDIMSGATDTEAVLEVFQTLRQVRGEIEVTRGRIQFLSESAALSAISVELIPDVAAQPLQIGGWRPEGTAKEAFTALIRALRTLGDAAIWAGICVVPIALIFGVPGYFAGRAIVRRRRAAKAQSGQSGQAQE